MNNFIAGWYLIYTKPNREKKIAYQLSEENIQFFLPTSKVIRNSNGRRKIVEVSLFPSYVFVYIQKIQDYFISLGMEGALYYVKFGKQVARVDDTMIHNLRILLEKGNDMEVSTDYFKPTQKLVIQQGPFAGLSCEVVEYRDKKRILVRISLLNRCVLVDLETHHLNVAEHFPVSMEKNHYK
jgi:transcriptional antiterminator RfaH